MKLKTLKDFEEMMTNISIKDLRQEAIKWIKKDMKEYDEDPIYLNGARMIFRWMKRFNITEENLK